MTTLSLEKHRQMLSPVSSCDVHSGAVPQTVSYKVTDFAVLRSSPPPASLVSVLEKRRHEFSEVQ